MTRRQLERAQAVLQRAHDYIEANGFDILVFCKAEDPGPSLTPAQLAKAKRGLLRAGPCCYVGATRLAAGVRPIPGDTTYEGDGPELKVALELLDEAARRSPNDRCLEGDTGLDPGQIAEALGFTIRARGDSSAQQQHYALRIFRSALSQAHKQLEKMT